MKISARTCISTLICGALIAAAGSCAFSQTYPVTVDGEQLRAGIYILRQQEAYRSATSKLKEEQPDLDTSAEGFSYLTQTVEGKSFRDWVSDKALENCREYVAVERLFDKYGLSLTAEELKDIKDNVKSLWTEENQYAQYFYGVSIVGDYYKEFGVGEDSFRDLTIYDKKHDKLFDHLYGEGGELAATADEINEALKKDYLAVNYFPYELENGAGAQSFADRIAKGETYEDVYRDYAQALTDEEAAKEAAEASAAEAEAAAEAESSDSENADEDASEPESEPIPEEDTDQPAAEGETPGDAAGTVVEVAEKDSLIQVLKKSNNTPSEDFVKQVSEMNNGDVKAITVTDGDTTKTYVVQKLDILAYPDKTEDAVSSLRSELKEDEFADMLKTTGASYTLTTDSSIGLYKLETIIDKT